MEAILKFNLEDRDDMFAFSRACASTKMAFFIWSMEYIQNEFKHKDNVTADQVFDYIREKLKEYNINIEEILE